MIEVLSDLGGLMEVLTSAFGLIVAGTSSFYFYQRLFEDLLLEEQKASKTKKPNEPKDEMGRKAEDFMNKLLKSKFKGQRLDYDHYLSLRRRLVSRQPLRVSYYEYIMGAFAPYICCMREESKKYYENRRATFDRAMRHLDQRFDGVRLARSIRQLDVIKSIILDKKNIELIRFAKCNTVDYSSEEDSTTKKDLDWRDFIGALKNFSTIVKNSPKDPIDKRLI